jgi:predicted nucleic acid-binding protein
VTEIVVSDAGPLIALGAVDLLSKLNSLFQVVYITPTVEHEVLCDPLKLGAPEIDKAIAAGLIKRKHPKNNQSLNALKELLDPGEAEAIALAEELRIGIILDERKGRRVAKHRGIPPRGTGAILIKLKQRGCIEAVAPYLQLFRSNGYRLSEQLCHNILDLCGEASSKI